MHSVGNTSDRPTKWLRRMARGTGSLVAGFWLFLSIVGAINESEPWTLESRILVGLIIASAGSVAVGWWREGVGGVLLVAVAVAHSTFAYFAAGHNKGLAMAISGGPLLVVGLLFLASWWRRRRDG